MPLPGRSARWATSQRQPLLGRIERSTPSRSESRARPPRRVSTRRPPAPSCSTTSVTTRALAVAVVARTGVSDGQPGEQVADAAVVGPEVVAPVADAVRLVDDEQAAAPGQVGQLLVAEPGVVEPLGADEQDVDLVRGQGRRAPRPSPARSRSSSSPRGCRRGRRRRPGRASARGAGYTMTVGPAPSARRRAVATK